MTKPNENVVKVKIFDQTYSLQGSQPVEYYERLAQYVDGKMRKIADGSHVVDTQKLAIMTALNIADDYYTIKKEFEELARLVEEWNLRACQKLDAVLKEPQAEQQAE